MNAFCRVAPSLRLRLLAIFLAGVLLRAADFSSRTSALVQARLFEFLLAMYDSPNLKTCLTLQQRASELCGGMTVAPKALKLGGVMNQLLIVVILIIGTLPLYGQGEQPNTAELAQKVVGIIAGDTTKTQTYCQVLNLSDELDQVDQPKDRKKAEDLSQKINELQKNLGPEYLALLEGTLDVDPNSKDGQEIVSIFDKLDSSCGDKR